MVLTFKKLKKKNLPHKRKVERRYDNCMHHTDI